MPRLIGVDIPGSKPIWVALTYIHGIGRSVAREICSATDIETQTKADELTDDELSRIATYIDSNLMVEGSLRRQVAQNVTRLREIDCYRGLRHRIGLPVRGQRTRTNARTRKGPRRTVAGKRGVKEVRRS